MTIIALKNQSTVVTNSQLQAVAAALQIQLTRDWYPVWRTTATIITLTSTQAIPAGAWPIYILDTSDVQGALGYHDEALGVPYGRIFVKTCQQYGYSWTVTLSHELLEMLANPNVNLTVFKQSNNTVGTIYFYEVGDPCQDDSFGYLINGILVSDFVYPAWYDTTATTPGTQYDQCRKITAPFQVGHLGYVSVFNVNKGSGWNTITKGDIVVPPGADKSGRNRMDR
jgi:hypothetical protein